jgi:DNA-binding response OmpR family regulator
MDAATAKPLILVADDDRHIVDLVALYLERSGYEVLRARNGDEALQGVAEHHPVLAIVDIMMPGQDGLQVCQALHRRGNPPVILLTARTSDFDKVAGLRLGADDYVTKPFNPEELVARVEAVLRRSQGVALQPAADVFEAAKLRVDLQRRLATISGVAVALTPKEFDLLAVFVRFPGVAMDRERLLDLVWGTSFYAIRTVDVHVARVREKLKGSGLRIETVWGTGYRIAEEG